jgi:hypothetical protein
LNLIREEIAGKPQFFSLMKVIVARAYQESKEAEEAKEKR